MAGPLAGHGWPPRGTWPLPLSAPGTRSPVSMENSCPLGTSFSSAVTTRQGAEGAREVSKGRVQMFGKSPFKLWSRLSREESPGLAGTADLGGGEWAGEDLEGSSPPSPDRWVPPGHGPRRRLGPRSGSSVAHRRGTGRGASAPDPRVGASRPPALPCGLPSAPAPSARLPRGLSWGIGVGLSR